jgi:hypothetical protein
VESEREEEEEERGWEGFEKGVFEKKSEVEGSACNVYAGAELVVAVERTGLGVRSCRHAVGRYTGSQAGDSTWASFCKDPKDGSDAIFILLDCQTRHQMRVLTFRQRPFGQVRTTDQRYCLRSDPFDHA